MNLLNPIWLFALAAVSIPVVVHLWNIKRGKTLKVGNISLYSESSPKSSRSFKLQDILLLMTRCLLLALLSLVLTGPFIQQQLNARKAKGWILIPEVDLRQTYRHFKPEIDSLGKAGYEFHFFRADFKLENLNELIKTYPDSSMLRDTLNYWALARQLNNKVPPLLPIALFTTNSAVHFTGSQPQTRLKINWNTYTPADPVYTWLAGAWLAGNGNIRVVQGKSAPNGNIYQYEDLKNAGSASAYHVSVENGMPVISLKDNVAEKTKVDTATQHVTIYTDKYSADATYLKAALDAINALTQRKTIIKVYSQANNIPANQDWLFWLSEKPADGTLAHKTRNLFIYKGGKVNEGSSWISNTGSYTITQGQSNILLYKSIAAKKPTGDALWTDGFGNPVLSIEQGNTNTYRFYSRFNPAWSDLVWNDEFPKWLLRLTSQPQPDTGYRDRRIISQRQLQLSTINGSNTATGPQTQQTNLANYLWLALVLIFFAERWLATKNNMVLSNG